MGYMMGIDLGTSSVKVIVAEMTGTILGIGQVGYEVQTPKLGYAQQNPLAWWDGTKQAIAKAVQCSGILADDIDGIGFSGQMHGVVALDQDKQLVGPAIIHLDQRSLEEKEMISTAARELLEAELLNQPGTGMLVCSLLWIKNHQPKVYEQIKYVMSPKDYIRYRLTGVISTDDSDASATLAFSVKNRRWCMELMQRLELKQDIWPQVYGSSEIVGAISGVAAKETGLSVKTLVVSGAGDCAAQLLGNGIIEEGALSCNIGTASQLAAVMSLPVFDQKMRCQTWCHSTSDTWYIQGGALNGGSTLSWLRKKVLGDTKSFALLDQEALEVLAGCEGLMFLPYLSGERTPFNNSLARGVYFGLGMKHDRSHMIRATMEGVMHNLCECRKIFDELGIAQKKLISSGGAAKGLTWKRIQADMMDMPVYTTMTEEEACLGGAMLAAIGIGFYKNAAQACKEIVELSENPVEPIKENVKRYQEQQEIFHDLYFSVERLFPKLRSY